MVEINSVHTLQFILDRNGLHKHIYDAMQLDDMGELVMVTLNVLNKTITTFTERVMKTKEASSSFREKGNQMFKAGNLADCLEYYNKALAFAPINSKEMVLALSNRSELLLKLQAYKASLTDIETCFKIGCSAEIQKKLKRRQDEAVRKMYCIETEKFTHLPVFEKLFILSNSHSHIPCTKGVEVKIEYGQTKIIAAENIKTGMVVALEHPFVSCLNDNNMYTSCYHCHRATFNLLPCDTCCFVLYCDEKCKSLCWNEIHEVECNLIKGNIESWCGMKFFLAVKAALKMKKASSWEELIAASKKIGTKRLSESSVSEIYNSDEKFSLLNYKENRDPHYGAVYRLCFLCADIIRILDKLSYFPKGNKKEESMRALARIIMKLSLTFPSSVTISTTAGDDIAEQLTNMPCNYGWFSFTSKLKHKCDANLIVVGLNNQVALVALKSIKKGEELTISFIEHAYEYASKSDVDRRKRALSLYKSGNICHCVVCEHKWKDMPILLSLDQMLVYTVFCEKVIEKINDYASLCELLTVLQNQPYSKEYQHVLTYFRLLVMRYQQSSCLNKFVMPVN